MPRAWSPSGALSGSSLGRASTRVSVARLVAPQALLAWIRSVPVVMSSCYAKSASLCPEWPVWGRSGGYAPRGILDGVKGGEKVFHCGGGIVYHPHDEKELNWEPGGVRSGAGVRRSGLSQESSGSSETW